MSASTTPTPPPGLNLEDIFFILFRHKWKIVFFFLAGLAAAVLIYLRSTPTYKSEAKLLVRYIVDNKAVTPADSARASQSPDSRGENIINSELEILTSFDLALEVVDLLKPEVILGPKSPEPTNRFAAAGMIIQGLSVEVPRRSNILKISLRNPNPNLVRPILSTLIDAYLKKHLEVHRSVGIFDDFLSQKTDELRSEMAETENQLRKKKTEAGVVSFEEARRGLAEEMSRLRLELHNTDSQLAERKAGLAELEKTVPGGGPGEGTELGIAQEKVDAYKSHLSQQEVLNVKLQELRLEFSEESTRIKAIRQQLKEVEAAKSLLEKENPKLASISIAPLVRPTSASGASEQPLDPRTEKTRIMILEAKKGAISNQLEQSRKEATAMEELSMAVAQLEGKRSLEETNYRYYKANLDQSRMDETLGVAKMSNINKVQAPSPPIRDLADTKKSMMIAIAGGLVAGLVLAFLLELVIDQTIKRPNEIENSTGLPVYLSVPEVAPGPGKGMAASLKYSLRKLIPFARPSLPAAVRSSDGAAAPAITDSENLREALSPFYQALRDRVVMFFEASKITRKPKMVGVTSFARGAGVTTIASGLAASLSNTGDGKVLLIDLNLQHGGIHPFFEGAPVSGLLDVLNSPEPTSARVHERLDVVSTAGSNGSAVSVRSKQFTDLMPRLKASDYDYIVFDLPPVNQTSATLRLAGFMDQILVVVEAGKTRRALVKRACSFLASSNPSVVGILNKAPCVLPGWLDQQDQV